MVYLFSPFFREFVFKNFSARLSKLISRIESVVFETIDQRICRALLESDEEIIAKTHHELAYELGTAREVVCRHFLNFPLAAKGTLILLLSSLHICYMISF